MKFKEMMNENGNESLEEGVKYPSQDDAEFMVELTNAMFGVYYGSASPKMRKLYEKMDELRRKSWWNVFGDNSPWTSVKKGSSGKLKVVWDKTKAKSLGL